jgi:hypothetical protein
VWLQPVDRLACLSGGIREYELRAACQLELYDSGDFDIAYLPLIHCWLDPLSGSGIKEYRAWGELANRAAH